MARIQTPVVAGTGTAERTGAEGGSGFNLGALGRAQSPSEGPIVAVDPDAPWANWPVPAQEPIDAKFVRLAAIEPPDPWGASIDPERGQARPAPRLAMVGPDGLLGFPTRAALQDLSRKVGFDTDFVLDKISDPELRAAVINDRLGQLAAADTSIMLTKQPFMVATPGGPQADSDGAMTITNASPGSRQIVPHGWVAQTVLNIMRQVYQEDVSVVSARLTDHGMEVRIRTNLTMEVTPGGRSVGDVLSMGILVSYRYGQELALGLYCERLVCTNGMTANREALQWKANGTTVRDQLDWVTVNAAVAVQKFPDVIEHARLMAQTSLGDHPEVALIERARAMRVPRSHEALVLEAYRAEPSSTEWGALNAITRYATHSEDVADTNRRRLQQTAGNWVSTFDMVNARLPRPMAEAIGASIYEESEA